MKRFFPLFIGLTIICYSFTLKNETSPKNVNELAVASHIELCEFTPNPNANGVGTSMCPGMPAELTIANDCTGSAHAKLLATNLAVSPIVGNVYPLPYGQPPIYYEYIYNGVTVTTGPITSLTFNGQLHKVGNKWFPIFEYELPMTFDCSSTCSAGVPNLYFDAKLVNNNGSLYDISNYADVDGIFYDAVFEAHPPEWYIQACAETCNGCGNKLVSHETNELISSQTFILENNPNEEEEKSLTMTPELEREFNFDISPNPFTSDINIQFSSLVDNAVSIQIIDVSGKTVYNNNNVNITDQSLRISGEILDSGLYYCRIVSNNEVRTKKLIKN